MELQSTSTTSKRLLEEGDASTEPADLKRVKNAVDSSDGSGKPDTDSPDQKSSSLETAGWARSRSRKGKVALDGKKAVRRDRRGTRAEGQLEGENVVKTPRLPKRQCALLIGFCGTGCNGMQMYVYL